MGAFALTGVGLNVAHVHKIVQNCRRENRPLFRIILNNEGGRYTSAGGKTAAAVCSCGGIYTPFCYFFATT